MKAEITFTGKSQGKTLQLMMAAANLIKNGGTVLMPGCTDPENKAERLGYLITSEVDHSPVTLDGVVVGHEFRLKPQVVL